MRSPSAHNLLVVVLQLIVLHRSNALLLPRRGCDARLNSSTSKSVLCSPTSNCVFSSTALRIAPDSAGDESHSAEIDNRLSSLDSNVTSDDTATSTISATLSSTTPSSSTSARPNGPTTEDLMLAMGTNPRRIFFGTLSATGIALAGNFLGVTSRLLTVIPEDQVEAIGIDTYFPRGDYKRCRTSDYTFVVPREWVADTFVELAKAQRRIQPLDYSMQRRSGGYTTLPDAAFGPAGRLNDKGVSETGDTNVSVIVSSGLKGFTLAGTLGSPTNAAEKLLSLSIAPEGSGRTATLLNAIQNGSQYKFEYLVDRGQRGPPLRNIAVIAANAAGDKLFTLTVVAPAEKWKQTKNDAQFRKIADSFHLR